VNTYALAHPDKSKQNQLSEAQAIWNCLKSDPSACQAKLNELRTVVAKRKAKNLSFWTNIPAKKVLTQEGPSAPIESAAGPSSITVLNETISQTSDSIASDLNATNNLNIKEVEKQILKDDVHVHERATPAESREQKRLEEINANILFLQSKQQKDLGDSETIGKELKNLETNKKKIIQTIKTLRLARSRAQTFRFKNKEKRKKFSEITGETIHDKPGRPRKEEKYPDLLNVIWELACSNEAGADPRRRSELMQCPKTLDDLTVMLNEKGYNIERTAVYRRLIPRRWNTNEGQRHVQSVPVKLVTAQFNARKKNDDAQFGLAAIRLVMELCTLIGPQNTMLFSPDDKARIALGIAAASKEQPIVMSTEYRVKLPDHDWVVAEKHKLIPSVYAFLSINDDIVGDNATGIANSGPTYIAIRSGKHDSSNAYSHGTDIRHVVHDERFHNFVKTPSGQVKPFWVSRSDGGPDENARYPKVIEEAINIFLDFDLDMYIVVITPRGYSAYNPCERRMAPLSHDICGLVLDHEHFGSHIGASGKIIDDKLEKKNFFHAMNVLASIWNKTIIDKNPVYAEAIPIPEGDVTLRVSHEEVSNLEWRSQHIMSSKYMLQVVKCTNVSCCKPFRYPQFQTILPNRFLPYPRVFRHTELGIEALPPKDPIPADRHFCKLSALLLLQDIHPDITTDQNKLRNPYPFDLYCPSVSMEDLQKRQCESCGMNFTTVVAKTNHSRICRKQKRIITEALTVSEVIKDPAVETSDGSDQHVCSPVCVNRKPLFELFGSFLVLPPEQRGNCPWIPDLEEPV